MRLSPSSFGREKEDRQRFEAANNEVLAQQHNIFWQLSLFSPTIGFLTRINMMVLLGYGGWLVAKGELPFGAGLVVFAGLLEQFSAQVNNVANIVNSVQQSLIGARRVFEILDANIEDCRNAADAQSIPKIDGFVKFERASFHYGKLDPVVRDIDLEGEAGSVPSQSWVQRGQVRVS